MTENESFLDPDQQTIMAFVGRKHSGKSKLIRHVALSYPWDQIVIDFHGDDRPWQLDEERKPGEPYFWEVSEDDIPDRWPEWKRPSEDDSVEIPMVLYYQPDAGSTDSIWNCDNIMKLAYLHTRCLVIVHEWGVLAKVHRTPPFTSRILSQGRNKQISLMMAMHRSHGVDPMTFVQADLVATFEVPNRSDKETIADGIGWNRDDFIIAADNLPPFGYLLYDRRPTENGQSPELLEYPPLSENELKEVMGPS